MTRLAAGIAAIAIALTLTVGLTGCGRLGLGGQQGAGAPDATSAPSPAATSADAGTDDVGGDVLADLDDVDDALTGTGQDLGDADAASRTNDVP